MTPTLKAMVEAMAAELLRQGEASDLSDVAYDPTTTTFMAMGVNGGEFDLEKVARAGLEALRPVTPIACTAPALIGSLAEHWRAEVVDAILKENPKP